MMANMELEAMDVVRKAQDGRLEQELDRIAVTSAIDYFNHWGSCDFRMARHKLVGKNTQND